MKLTEIEILQEKISPLHNDSFFYEGDIAKLGNCLLVACGDIRIHKYDDKGKYLGMHDNFKPRDDFEFIENDKDLERISGDDHYEWVNNNWFEVIDATTNDSVMGDVEYGYDEAIELLKRYHEQDFYPVN